MRVSIKALPLALIILVVMFGGILAASQLGFWQTSNGGSGPGNGSGRNRVITQAADIRGSSYLSEISSQLGIPLEDIANAYYLPINQMDTLKAKDLEHLADSVGLEFEGTDSIRVFAACYLGEHTGTIQHGVLPQAAITVLIENGSPNEGQREQLLILANG